MYGHHQKHTILYYFRDVVRRAEVTVTIPPGDETRTYWFRFKDFPRQLIKKDGVWKLHGHPMVEGLFEALCEALDVEIKHEIEKPSS